MELCLTDRNKDAVKTPLCGIFHRTTEAFDAVDRKCMIKGLNSAVEDLVKEEFSPRMVNAVEQDCTIPHKNCAARIKCSPLLDGVSVVVKVHMIQPNKNAVVGGQ